MPYGRFRIRRECSVCGKPFTLDLTKPYAVNVKICSLLCRIKAKRLYKQRHKESHAGVGRA